MILGHIAVGFASKRLAPRTSLGLLIAAPVALDLIWPVLVLKGWEEVRIQPGATAFTPLEFVRYPWSHSLLSAAILAVAAALLYAAFTRYWRGAVVIGLGVLSHWICDAIVHKPDLPLTPWSAVPLIGLGLWNSVAGTIALELTMFAIAVWLYTQASKPADRGGFFGFWGLMALLLLIYFGNEFGPPPPDAHTIAVAAMGMWAVVLWAWWADSHHVYTRSL